MLRRILEPEKVEDVKRPQSIAGVRNREPRQVFRFRFRQIEREQRLRISSPRLDREAVLLLGNVHVCGEQKLSDTKSGRGLPSMQKADGRHF